MSGEAVSPPTPAATPAPQGVFGARTYARTHMVTHGEKKFDTVNYTYLGYVINALMSVGAMGWVERTHSGQKTMNRFVAWAQKTLPSVNPETTKFYATKSFFLSGGFTVLLPMKWMESAKTSLVKTWNREFYGDAVDTDPALLQSQHELEAAPKQSWGSIAASRVLALVPFYLTVGLLWERGSLLSRFTNPELKALGKEGAKALEKSDPAQFSQIASKGIYFDRPIANVSRKIGKAWAKLSGDAPAVAKLEEMETRYPGMIKQGSVGTHDRDTHHSSLPYYVISEAITSGMVAWGVYALSRVLAPVMGKKQAAQSAEPALQPPPVPALPDAEPAPQQHTQHESGATLAKNHEQTASIDVPNNEIALDGLEHHRTATVPKEQLAQA